MSVVKLLANTNADTENKNLSDWNLFIYFAFIVVVIFVTFPDKEKKKRNPPIPRCRYRSPLKLHNYILFPRYRWPIHLFSQLQS